MNEKRRLSISRVIIIVILTLLLLLLTGYLLLAFYYRDGFGLNTWINGIYCTGKSAEEVNRELMLSVDAPVIKITVGSGDGSAVESEINLADVGFGCDYLPALKRFLDEQNPYLWIDNITFHKNHQIQPDITYDAEAFRKAFDETVAPYYERPSGDYVLKLDSREGWTAYDGLTHLFDVDKAFLLVQEAIAQGQYEFDIDRMDCFYDIPFTAGQEERRELFKRLDEFVQCDLVYDMGDVQIKLDRLTASYMLQSVYREDIGMDYPVLDGDGQLVLDAEQIKRRVALLAEEYDTYGKERKFASTRGDIITVPSGGTYGTTLDQEAEVDFLMENLLSGKLHDGEPDIHVPSYIREGYVRGKDDIGGTYIEVDMTGQHMYYYVDGELKLDTDIVTGNTGRRMGTPEGVNYVYDKQRNRVLRGRDYATPVKYWMPVKGHVGIHDAGWRSKFGGEIYKTGGSHGCINTPSEAMAELYDMVEVGTPVIMFY